MYWPTPQDYNESVQMPEYSFADEQLTKGTPELTPIGLPKPVTGNFASVYRFETGQKFIAVKCFLRNVLDQQQRYVLLSQFMAANNTPYIVDFEYVSRGIRVKTDWYPILKMDWVEGIALDQYLRKHAGNRANIERILSQFAKVIGELKRLGIAHGDLQHGNIIVQPSDLRLVDYDGMFVPALTGETSNELGHPSYQHPQRTATNFSASLDDFSAWLIYSSLTILTREPMLFKKYAGGDECILFRHPDLKDPDNSRLFRELLNHPNADVKARAELIKRLAECPISRIPAFQEQIPPLDNIPKEIRTVEVSSAEKKTGLPDWMLPDDVTATVFKPSPAVQKPAARPIPSHLRQPPRFPTKMKWPTNEQYDKAFRAPASCFRDPELSNSNPIVKLKINGKNGIVYQVSTKEKQFAIKCFIEELAERTTRYEEVAKLKDGPVGKYLVDFDYMEEGIKVQDHWFPCLKMSWQQGESLDQYACNMLGTNNKAAIDKLINDFRMMSLAFLDNGIAHGDLEPSNILIDHSGAIKLVDYDAMYTPALRDLPSGEVGSPVYQHPSRNASHFGPWLDNFPALIIDSVLTAMVSGASPNSNWGEILQKLRPRTWSPGDPRSPATRRSRLIKDMQMAKVENVSPLNAAIKL